MRRAACAMCRPDLVGASSVMKLAFSAEEWHSVALGGTFWDGLFSDLSWQ
jgi:hypothetical protein